MSSSSGLDADIDSGEAKGNVLPPPPANEIPFDLHIASPKSVSLTK